MKKIIIAVIGIVLFVIGCSSKEASDIVTKDYYTNKVTISGTKNIWIMGDSLAAAASKGNDSEGWGSYLQLFLKSGASVKNTAIGGASASSYINGGPYNLVMDNLQENDCVLIQFGHNDAYNMDIYTDPYSDSDVEGSFKWILKNQYILPILEKGAYPFLATSVVAADFDENGELYHMIYADHAQAMRELVEECKKEGLNVFLIDTYKITDQYYREIGETEAKALHSGNHYNRDGAIYAAGVVADEMKNAGVECFNDLRSREEVEQIDVAGNYDIYALGINGMVTNADVTELENQYINDGMDRSLAKDEAIDQMLKREALYQKAIKEGYTASENEVEAALTELKNITKNSVIRRSLVTYVSEDNYWNYKTYVIKRDLSVDKYVAVLKDEYTGDDFDTYLDELMIQLVEEENYVIILNRGYNIE